MAHKVALLGFSGFETSTLESFFRLIGRSAPGYEIVKEFAQADLVIINADDEKLLRSFLQYRNSQKVLLVGKPVAHSEFPIVERPIQFVTLLLHIGKLMTTLAPTKKPTAPAAASNVTDMKAPGLDIKTAAQVHLRKAEREQAEATDGLGPAIRYDEILVVDDSDIALKFMQNRLTRFGFRAELADSGEAALARLSVKPFKFVFLDVMMEGLDGYQTCRAIKRRGYPEGQQAPVVIMLTSRGTSVDRVRGSLSGCDAYLTKPLNESELIEVLMKYDNQTNRSFRRTDMLGLNDAVAQMR